MSQGPADEQAGIEIGSAQGNPYWPEDQWTEAEAEKAIDVLDRIARA